MFLKFINNKIVLSINFPTVTKMQTKKQITSMTRLYKGPTNMDFEGFPRTSLSN